VDRTKSRLATAIAALSVAAASPAWAHHSAAMFDAGKTRRIAGEVTAIEWTNPHIWLSIKSDAGEGAAAAAWHFEMVGPAALARLGFTRDMFTPGTRIVVEHHPLRDGRPGGQLMSVTFADGRTLRAVAGPGPAN
jgi:hypothetical protein